jgi:hypothetical protein
MRLGRNQVMKLIMEKGQPRTSLFGRCLWWFLRLVGFSRP